MKRKPIIRYSLRSLFLATTLVGVTLVPLAQYTRERMAASAAIASIRLVGGETYSDWRSVHCRDYLELINGRYKLDGTRFVFDEDRFPRGEGEVLTITQRLYLSLGAAPPEDVVCVKLVGEDVNDERLSVIVGNLRLCSRLRVLLLIDTKVTDSGLRSIGQLRQLRVLGLKQNCNTECGVLILQQALPGCELVRDAQP